jgi:hypothetical protein
MANDALTPIEQQPSGHNGSLRLLRLRAAYLLLSIFVVSVAVDMASTTYETPVGLVAVTAPIGIWLFGVRPQNGSTHG